MSLATTLLGKAGPPVHQLLAASATVVGVPSTGQAALVLDASMLAGLRRHKPAVAEAVVALTREGPGGTRFHVDPAPLVLALVADILEPAARLDALGRIDEQAPAGIAWVITLSEEGLAVAPLLVCAGLTKPTLDAAMVWLAQRHEPRLIELGRAMLRETGTLAGHVGLVLATETPPITASVVTLASLEGVSALRSPEAQARLDAGLQRDGILPIAVVTPKGVLIGAVHVATLRGQA